MVYEGARALSFAIDASPFESLLKAESCSSPIGLKSAVPEAH